MRVNKQVAIVGNWGSFWGTLGDGGRHLPVGVLMCQVLFVLVEGCSGEGAWRGITILVILSSLHMGTMGAQVVGRGPQGVCTQDL